MPAGPSEVMVLADETCNPAFVAADLLSQAEHGADSQAVLVSDSESVINAVQLAVNEQLQKLERRDIAKMSLEKSKMVLVKGAEPEMPKKWRSGLSMQALYSLAATHPKAQVTMPQVPTMRCPLQAMHVRLAA